MNRNPCQKQDWKTQLVLTISLTAIPDLEEERSPLLGDGCDVRFNRAIANPEKLAGDALR
jgi:hypothetical protein